MAVAFDAVGPSSSGFSSTTTFTSGSWSHTISASATALLVCLGFDGTASSGVTVSCTAGGTSMTLLKKDDTGGAGLDSPICVFGLLNPPTGSVTIAFTASFTGATPDTVMGESLSFTGASAFGTPAAANGPSASATVTVTGVASTSLTAAFIGAGDAISAPTSSGSTSRCIDNVQNSGGADAGNNAGATTTGSGSVATTWSTGFSSGTSWVAIGVEVLAPSGPPQGWPGPATQIPLGPQRGPFDPLSRQFGPRQPFWYQPAVRAAPPAVYPVYAGTAAATVTVQNSTGAGDGIVVTADTGAQVTAVSDSRGNTYLSVSNDTADDNCMFAATYNGTPGTPTVRLVAGVDTISCTGASSGGIVAVGVQGIVPQAPDATPVFAGQTTASPTGPSTGTLSQQGDILVYSIQGGTGVALLSWGDSMNGVGGAGGIFGGAAGMWTAYKQVQVTSSDTPSATLASSVRSSSFVVALLTVTPPAGNTAPVYPLHAPVRSRIPQPVRGGSTDNRNGVFAQQGPVVRQLGGPVALVTRPLIQRKGRTGTTVALPLFNSGPPVRPLGSPVSGQVRGLPPSGRVISRAGTLTSLAPQAGPPVYPLGHPVQARRQPLRGGSTDNRNGVFAQAGPPVRYLPGPVRGQPQKPLLTGRAEHRAGVRGQQGPPVTPLRGPVAPRSRPLPRDGRQAARTGAFAQQGPPVRQLHGPIMARQPLPARGRTQSRAGVFTTFVPQGGPPVYPLGRPVQARLPLQPLRKGRTATMVALPLSGSGPPVRQPQGPVQARQPLPARGRAAWRQGTYTLVVVGQGAPFYPLNHPVTARPPLPLRGRSATRAGSFGQPGPAVRPLPGPVMARQPLPPKGRAVRRYGLYAQAGPPVKPLPGPVGVWRKQPPWPYAGRTDNRDGVRAQQGPPVIQLRRPVQAQRNPYRPGHGFARAGIWQSGLPPPVTPGTSLGGLFTVPSSSAPFTPFPSAAGVTAAEPSSAAGPVFTDPETGTSLGSEGPAPSSRVP